MKLTEALELFVPLNEQQRAAKDAIINAVYDTLAEFGHVIKETNDQLRLIILKEERLKQ